MAMQYTFHGFPIFHAHFGVTKLGHGEFSLLKCLIRIQNYLAEILILITFYKYSLFQFDLSKICHWEWEVLPVFNIYLYTRNNNFQVSDSGPLGSLLCFLT